MGHLTPVAPWCGPGHGLERSPQLRLTEETACRGDIGDGAIGVSAKEPLRFGHPDRPQFFGERPGRVAEHAEQRPPGQVTAASHGVRVEIGITKGPAQGPLRHRTARHLNDQLFEGTVEGEVERARLSQNTIAPGVSRADRLFCSTQHGR